MLEMRSYFLAAGIHCIVIKCSFLDRPACPDKPVATDVQESSVTLQWNTPEDDGGCEIGSYIVEYNRVLLHENQTFHTFEDLK